MVNVNTDKHVYLTSGAGRADNVQTVSKSICQMDNEICTLAFSSRIFKIQQ